MGVGATSVCSQAQESHSQMICGWCLQKVWGRKQEVGVPLGREELWDKVRLEKICLDLSEETDVWN